MSADAIAPELLRRILEPPLRTRELAGIGGRLRARPEDFVVEEIPAYPPSGRGSHLFVRLEKRELTTEDAVRIVGHELGIGRGEIGVAGLKDRDAVTAQWISLPERAAAALQRFSHGGIRLGPIHIHDHKLRRGHLHGNRFAIVVRETVCAPEEALERARRKLATVVEHGLANAFGPQRFSAGGRNLGPGIAALESRRRPDPFMVSVVQSAIFNLVLHRRIREGLIERVVSGDVLKKVATGGMFRTSDAEADQRRLDAGELVITGPIHGTKTMSPAPETDAWRLEQDALAELGLSATTFERLGRAAPGSRRPLLVTPEDPDVARIDDDLGPGVRVSVSLPAGSYATQLLRELMAGGNGADFADPL